MIVADHEDGLPGPEPPGQQTGCSHESSRLIGDEKGNSGMPLCLSVRYDRTSLTAAMLYLAEPKGTPWHGRSTPSEVLFDVGEIRDT